jgi:hypothetical protein
VVLLAACQSVPPAFVEGHALPQGGAGGQGGGVGGGAGGTEAGGSGPPLRRGVVVDASALEFDPVHEHERSCRVLHVQDVGEVAESVGAGVSGAAFSVARSVVPLEPGATEAIEVCFAPDVGARRFDGLLHLTGGPGPIDVTLGARSLPGGVCRYQPPSLFLVPEEVAFGPARVGIGAARWVTLRSCLAAPVRVTAAWAPGSSAAFAVEGLAEGGVELGPGNALQFAISYDRLQAGLDEGILSIAAGAEMLALPLEGEAQGDDPSDPPSCLPDAYVWVGDSILLRPPEGGVPSSCTWSLESAPFISRAQPADPGACTTTFAPDEEGLYVLVIEQVDAGGNVSTCRRNVYANVYVGERIVLTSGTAAGVDLHLHESLDPFDPDAWFDLTYDCNAENAWPYWDTLGRYDDPRWALDDSAPEPREQVSVGDPTSRHGATVGVHWSGDERDLPFTASVRIECSGLGAAELLHTFTRAHEAAPLARVSWQADRSCKVEPLEGTLLLDR